MEAKIKVASVKQYTTTDRKTFTGQGAQQKASEHQERLDKQARIKAVHEALVNHLHDLLGLDLPPKELPKSSPFYEDNYEKYKELLENYEDSCSEVLEEIGVSEVEDLDDLASMVSRFFFLIGKEKWGSIASLLGKEKWSWQRA